MNKNPKYKLLYLLCGNTVFGSSLSSGCCFLGSVFGARAVFAAWTKFIKLIYKIIY